MILEPGKGDNVRYYNSYLIKQIDCFEKVEKTIIHQENAQTSDTLDFVVRKLLIFSSEIIFNVPH
jgi:hypothetical protein